MLQSGGRGAVGKLHDDSSATSQREDQRSLHFHAQIRTAAARHELFVSRTVCQTPMSRQPANCDAICPGAADKYAAKRHEHDVVLWDET